MFPPGLAVPAGPVRERRAVSRVSSCTCWCRSLPAGAHQGLVHRWLGWLFEEILGEAEFSLRERFESSLPEQISHFSSGPDPLVGFGVHRDALTI